MTTEADHLPRALSSLLTDLKVPLSHVLDVAFEPSPKTAWVVSLDRAATGKLFPYATVRPGDVRYFDTMDEAVSDAGGQATALQVGEYYELVDAMNTDRPLPFQFPITFKGIVGELLLLSAPAGMMSSGQAHQFNVAARSQLTAMTKDSTIPREAKFSLFMVPEGVRILRLVERKAGSEDGKPEVK